jgi:N-methylhydantoinase A
LCATGDATTALRDERSRTFVRRFSETSAQELAEIFETLASEAAQALETENVSKAEMRTTFEADLRYHGQGLRLTVEVELDELKKKGLSAISDKFDEEHKRLFTFALDLEHELVSLRAAVRGKGIEVKRPALAQGKDDASAAIIGQQAVYMDGKDYTASVYDRAKLQAGNRVPGPAIVTEMDSTTVILPGHHGAIDAFGNILIYPDGYDAKAARERTNAQK